MISRSQRFMNRLQTITETHLHDPAFSVSDLSKVMEVSESTLRRKLLQYAGMTPNQYIRRMRLKI